MSICSFPTARSCCWPWSTSPWRCCACHSDDHSRISFDANDYRLLRIEELRLSAATAADKVKRTGAPFRFNPMNSRERRVIHLALRNETAVRSESIGAGPARHVVVYPAGMASLPELPAETYAPGRERGTAGAVVRADGSSARPPRPGTGRRRPRNAPALAGRAPAPNCRERAFSLPCRHGKLKPCCSGDPDSCRGASPQRCRFGCRIGSRPGRPGRPRRGIA